MPPFEIFYYFIPYLFFFFLPIFQKTYTIEYLVFPGTEQRFSALKHSVAILRPKLLVRSRVPSLFLCLRTKTLIIHPLKHLVFWGTLFSCLLRIFGILKSICIFVFLLQVQSTSWMPHQQYVMQPTVSASPVLPAVAALGRPISRRVCLCVLLSALRLARRVERETPIQKKLCSLHFPKNNLAIHPLLVKLERNCSWINTSNHVSAPLQVIELKVKQLHPCRNYSSTAQELLKSK